MTSQAQASSSDALAPTASLAPVPRPRRASAEIRRKPLTLRAPTPSGRRRHGRSRNRLFVAVITAVTMLAIAGAGSLYLKFNSSVGVFDSSGLSDDRPAATPGSAKNILLIGSDTRTGSNPEFGGGRQNAIGRSDTAILLHLYGDQRRAVGVSIPRDALVDIPPCLLPNGTWTRPRRHAMFNSAFSVGEAKSGNPACTQNTVEALTGLRMDHTIVVDFQGFAAMTDAVGGVPVCLPNDIYQKDLDPGRRTRGSLLYHQGEQKVSGKAAVDYVRLRHGIGDGSDIGRTKRQQAFLSSLIRTVKERGYAPTTLIPLATAATESLTVDPGLGSADRLLAFAMTMKDIDLANIRFLTAPWRYDGSRVDLVHPDIDALWDALKADRAIEAPSTTPTATSTTPAGTSSGPTASPPTATGAGAAVTVYNGTTVPSLAARASELLRAHRFAVTGTGNYSRSDHPQTVIQYGTGREPQAQALAQLFPGARLEPGPGTRLTLIIGRDYARAPSSPASTSAPSPRPSSLASQARPADSDLCAGLS